MFRKVLLVGATVFIAGLVYVYELRFASDQPTRQLADNGQPISAPETLHQPATTDKFVTLADPQPPSAPEFQPAATMTAAETAASLEEDRLYEKVSQQLSIETLHDPDQYDLSGIDQDLVDNGTLVSSGMGALKSLAKGSEVEISLMGEPYSGVVEKNLVSGNLGNTYVKIRLGQTAEYLNVYYGSQIARGKIYTADASYLFEDNGKIGFVIPIYEYKKLKNALFID